MEDLASDLLLLNSKNGILSETDGRTDSDYIIPSGPYDEHRDSPPLHYQSLENGSAAEVAANSHGEGLQNGVSTEGSESDRKAECGMSRKPREKPQRQRHLEKVQVDNEEQKTFEVVNHQESPAAELNGPKVDTKTEPQDLREPRDATDSACDAASSAASHPASTGLLAQAEQEAAGEASATGQQPDLQVPAAPRKPLPVPQPRKHKKTSLVRQDGVEQPEESRPEEPYPEELKPDVGEEPTPCTNAGLADAADADIPIPPPRQKSLSPRLHRTYQLSKTASHSLLLLAQPNPGKSNDHDQQGQQQEEEEDGGYGDFERYPSSHSLPKQIKLTCQPPRGKSLPSDDPGWPRAPPRKPQRHSLPAPPPPTVCAPAAPPHANTPMRELPAPPQERAAWRFTFFSRHVPARSSMPPKSRTPAATAAAALGGKQRAQSFSTADLATRADPQKRGLSFRKLLELPLSVKMLPKLLAKGGHSLDCTTATVGEGGKSNRTRGSSARPKSCSGEVDICREEEQQEEQAEYENVPLYEEIPEYMNLPFHSARQAWSHDPGVADTSDIYELQDPYRRYQEHEYERCVDSLFPCSQLTAPYSFSSSFYAYQWAGFL